VATVDEAMQAALARHHAGQFAEAEQIYRQILEVLPNHADARHLLGIVAHQTGRSELAIECILQAIALNPNCEGYYLNLGGVYLDQGRVDDSILCFRQALLQKGDLAPAYYNLATALRLKGQFAESADSCREAIRLNPGYAEAHNNLGATLQVMGQLFEAQEQFEQALRLNPSLPDGYFNLGNVLRLQGRYDEAVRYCRQALQMKPQSADSYSNLGAALLGQGSLAEAIANLREAVRIAPRLIEAQSNLATALRQAGQWDESLALSRQVVSQDPKFASAHLNLAYSYLLAGDFARGWEHYEWRPDLQVLAARQFAAPRWDGSSLEGKTILVYDEQGLGDSLQFARFIPLLQRRGARVVLECHRPLARLLRSCPGIADVIPRGDPLPVCDFHSPLLSVARLLGIELATIPAEVPYLFADRELTEVWRQRLAGDRFKVGLVWQGSTHHQGDRYRSLRLDELAAQIALPGVRYYSLQKGAGREQLAGVAKSLAIEDLAADLHDFADTAAAVQQLDLLISCDSAPVHLAGALGVRTWVPLHFSPDWRWLLGRDDSPWYPTLRLFRQSTLGDWREVFQRLADELRPLVAGL
jgi:tetratricopeptide (TPR) repeat protein